MSTGSHLLEQIEAHLGLIQTHHDRHEALVAEFAALLNQLGL